MPPSNVNMKTICKYVVVFIYWTLTPRWDPLKWILNQHIKTYCNRGYSTSNLFKLGIISATWSIVVYLFSSLETLVYFDFSIKVSHCVEDNQFSKRLLIYFLLENDLLQPTCVDDTVICTKQMFVCYCIHVIQNKNHSNIWVWNNR